MTERTIETLRRLSTVIDRFELKAGRIEAEITGEESGERDAT